MARSKKGKKAKKKAAKKRNKHVRGRDKFHMVELANGAPTKNKIVVENGDRVAWVNADAKDWYVTFPAWPFAEPQAPIQVSSGNGTAWYLVAAHPPQGQQVLYSYFVKAHPNDPDPPPDGPGVIADGG